MVLRTLTPQFSLFDLSKGAGAPRLNITTTAGFVYFAGCIHGAQTPAPQDPTQWNRVRFSATEGTLFPQLVTNPPFVFGVTRVRSIDIVFDEGTEVVSPSGPTGPGLAVLDNIDINGKLITRGRGIEPDAKHGHGHDDDDDDD